MSLNPFDVDDKIKEGAEWAYEGIVEVLNGLWKPFADRAFGLINLLGDNLIPVLGKTTAEEYAGMWNALRDIHGERTGFLMDHPDVSPFPDGLGLFVIYRDAATEREAMAQATDHGIGRPSETRPVGTLGAAGRTDSLQHPRY